MSEETTVGKLLLKNSVPEHLKPFITQTTLDGKAIKELFAKLVEGSSDVYKDAVSKLARLGFEVSTQMGSTVTVSDLIPPPEKDALFKVLEHDIAQVRTLPGSKEDKERKIIELYAAFTKKLEDTIIEVGIARNHTLAKVIRSGSRGSPAQYRQTIASPVLVSDEKGRPMTEFPIHSSFSEGLTLPEYLAHSYGTRQGAIATKLSIADSGYMSKQLSRAAMPLIVEEHDCGTHNGVHVPTSDKDSIGTFLAHSAGSYNRNNEVTGKMIADLLSKGVNEIIVRSPMTCQASKKSHAWAICQMCSGRREKGTIPHLGTYIGLTAATALGEPLAQGQLNTKHTSSGASLGKTVATGFKLIQQLANIPHNFQSKAAVAELDGTVHKVRNLPQGGMEIVVANGAKSHNHYVPAGFASKVAVNDSVEAGDIMSEGIVNPADIVRHKGIGEGRRYFSEAMRTAFNESGMPVNRRNFEIIARAAVDHVKVNHPEGIGEYLPDSIVSYHALEKDYKPRTQAKLVRPDAAHGKYLEEPVLHYTIGTRITNKVIENMKKHKITSVHVHDEPPHFAPEMQRLLDVPSHVPDWAHQLYSNYLEKKLINGVSTGMFSSLKGPSPIMGLSYGVGFGEKTAEEE